jgi:predicted membrane-bound spermidine synthase
MARHLYVLFLLSGLSGLVYESMWSRYLRLFVGSAATAQILVLALFMGGMSLGALLAGRRSARIRRPILAYGLIEGAIGLYALAFPWVFGAVTRLCYDVVFPAIGGGAGISVVKWSCAAAVILPPCLLLGMTFPLMSVGILRRDRERSGEILSFLYFTNSLGASIGAVATGYLLVPRLGLTGTLAAAAVLNLLIMAIAVRERTEHAPLAEGRDEGSSAAPGSPPLLTLRMPLALMLGTAFGTGLSSFMYEVGWIRLLSMVLGSATRSFEVMLSAFVFGLAVGGLWVRRRMDRFARPVLVLGLVQLVMGVAAVATLPLYRIAVLGMGAVFFQDERTYTMWLTFNVVRYLLCLLIMLPATFCAGMTLPLLTHVLLREGRAEAVVGRIYGLNTLGAICGAIAAGIVLMPVIGLKGAIVLGAIVDMGLGVMLVRAEAQRPDAPAVVRKLQRSTTLATVMVGVVAWFFIRLDPMILSAQVFRKGQTRLHPDYELVSHVDGRTATITVIHDTQRPGYFTIFTNGKPDASVRTIRYPEGRDRSEGPLMSGDEPTQILVGMIPALLQPDSRKWAMIGIGSGVSSDVILGSPVLERLETIEIEPEMAAGAGAFDPVNRRTFEDPRSVIVFDDAKAWFAGAAGQYDVIVSEPSNPWVSGVASLFTVEFYQEVKRYIAPGGLLAQWIQGYELNDDLLHSVLAAVDHEFADYQIYRIGSRDWVIVASPDHPIGPLHPEPLREWEAFRERGELLGIHDLGQIHTLMVANKRMLHPFLSQLTPNRDEHPILDDGAEKARFFRASAESLLSLRWTPMPALEVFGGVERIPYPARGIPDDREDRHILVEPEKALALMHRYETGAWRTGAAEMAAWIDQRDALGDDRGRWETWFHATYEVYNLTASWVDLRERAWWREVVQLSRRDEAPVDVVAAIGLLDAVVRRDGDELHRRVQDLRAHPTSLFDERLAALAGLVALELRRAPATDRRAYVVEYMERFGNEDDSDDRAYQILRGFAARPDDPLPRSTAVAPTPSPARTLGFGEHAAGAVPPGLLLGETNPANHPAVWSVVERDDAPSPPSAFGIVRCDNPKAAVFELALLEDSHLADVDLEVSVRAVDGVHDRGGGLVWRAQGFSDYYVARWNPLEGNLRIALVEDSNRVTLAETDVALDPSRWHRLHVVAEGPHIEVTIDDLPPLIADDTRLPGPGRVGLWTKADAKTLFDDLVIAEP